MLVHRPQPQSPLCCLPCGPLHHIFALLSLEHGGTPCAVRVTCHCLRDAFDASNARLALGGRQMLSPQTTLWTMQTAQGRWQEAPGLRTTLLHLLGRSRALLTLSLRPQLWWLTLSEVLAAAGPRVCARLRTLVLSARDTMPSSDLHCVSWCTHLQHLDLKECRALTHLAPLSALARLVHLDLAMCQGVDSLQPLASCHELRNVTLWAASKVQDLSPLAASPFLECLDASYCSLVEDVAPLASCTRLRHLALCCCLRLTTVAPLVACRQLHTLDIRHCALVMDFAPVAHCTNLLK